MGDNDKNSVAWVKDINDKLKERFPTSDLDVRTCDLAGLVELMEKVKVWEAVRLKEEQDIEKARLKKDEEAKEKAARDEYARGRYVGSGGKYNQLNMYTAIKGVFNCRYGGSKLEYEKKVGMCVMQEELMQRHKFLGSVFNLVAMDWLGFKCKDREVMKVLKSKKDGILTSTCGCCYPEQNNILYNWLNEAEVKYVQNAGQPGTKKQFVLKIKWDSVAANDVKFTKVDLWHMDREDQLKMAKYFLRNTWDSEHAKRRKRIVALEDRVVGEVENGGRFFTCCNLFCCKDVIRSEFVEQDASVVTDAGKTEFGLFLKAMKGLSMKDVFMYVLKKVYMDIGPKRLVFKELFKTKPFTLKDGKDGKAKMERANRFPESWTKEEETLFATIRGKTFLGVASMVLVVNDFFNIFNEVGNATANPSIGELSALEEEGERPQFILTDGYSDGEGDIETTIMTSEENAANNRMNQSGEELDSDIDMTSGGIVSNVSMDPSDSEDSSEGKWVVMWVAFQNSKKEDVVQCQGIELAAFEKVEDAVSSDVLLRVDKGMVKDLERTMSLRVRNMVGKTDDVDFLEKPIYVLSVVNLENDLKSIGD